MVPARSLRAVSWLAALSLFLVTASGPLSASAGRVVVDANGQLVGPLLDQNTVLVTWQGEELAWRALSIGLARGGVVEFYHFEADCSDQRLYDRTFLSEFDVMLPRSAGSTYGNHVITRGEPTQEYVLCNPDMPNQTCAPHSVMAWIERLTLPTDINDPGICEPWGGFLHDTKTLGPLVIEGALPDFVPPLRVESDPAAGGFVSLTPCRIADSRSGPAIAAGTTTSYRVQGNCGVPPGAGGAVVNLTIVGAQGAGHATMRPAGAVVGQTSIVNFTFGQTIANATPVGLASVTGLSDPDLEVDLRVSSAHIVVDVLGYFP
jgi:hypothetical protein